MRQFNAKQIQEMKAHFKKSKFPELKMEVAGRSFNYFLLPQRCNAALPDFVVMATTQFARERIMAISTERASTCVTTTGLHLARRIGEALSRAYKGDFAFRYADAEQSIKVYWER